MYSSINYSCLSRVRGAKICSKPRSNMSGKLPGNWGGQELSNLHKNIYLQSSHYFDITCIQSHSCKVAELMRSVKLQLSFLNISFSQESKLWPYRLA